jgi:hypothetical protein
MVKTDFLRISFCATVDRLKRFFSLALKQVFLAYLQGSVTFYSYAILIKLEERHIRFGLGYMPSSIQEFYLAPIHPLFDRLFSPSIGIRAG